MNLPTGVFSLITAKSMFLKKIGGLLAKIFSEIKT